MNKPEFSPDNFLLALGGFVNQFAFTENVLFLFLVLLLGIPQAECAAILSGSKTAACCSAIRRLYEARGQAVPTVIEESLVQLMIINGLRNDMLHSGVGFDGSVSSHARSMPTDIRAFKVSSNLIRLASQDLFKISTTLNLFHAPILAQGPDRKMIEDALKAPWRYKSVSPESTRQQRHPKPQKQKRPRGSSPA